MTFTGPEFTPHKSIGQLPAFCNPYSQETE
jgi:hypothetical protein